jgi:hypothetical protein
MIIQCKQALGFKADGQDFYSIPAGYVGDVPDWVAATDFFKLACNGGTITCLQPAPDSMDIGKRVGKAVEGTTT